MEKELFSVVVPSVRQAHMTQERPTLNLGEVMVIMQVIQDYTMDQHVHLVMVEEFEYLMTKRSLPSG